VNYSAAKLHEDPAPTGYTTIPGLIGVRTALSSGSGSVADVAAAATAAGIGFVVFTGKPKTVTYNLNHSCSVGIFCFTHCARLLSTRIFSLTLFTCLFARVSSLSHSMLFSISPLSIFFSPPFSSPPLCNMFNMFRLLILSLSFALFTPVITLASPLPRSQRTGRRTLGAAR
jgi:hypothetical protein